jgi:dihydroorotase
MREATALFIEGATLADGRVRDVRVDRETGRIDAVGEDLSAAASAETIDAAGKRLLPGMIDAHVHFREPGFSHKETWETGSKSAAAGGVTTAIDQPNTDPPTVTGGAVREKAGLATDSLVDFGINGGVTPDWDPDSLLAAPITALGEVFLADSTGEMGIDADRFRAAVERATGAGVTVTVHAEDADHFEEAALTEADDGRGRNADADAWSAYRSPEAELAAVERACDVADAVGTRIHVAHTSTPEGIDAASGAGMTCEVTPHHLLLSRDDLDDLGTFGRMNPPLRSETRRKGVYERVRDGTVEMIATDHAPHTEAEKAAPIPEAPSGVPGVETALPLLLNEAREGRLGYERVRDLTARNPAAVFDLPRKGQVTPGYDADLVLFDPEATREIRGRDLHSKCGWTPFEGRAGVFPEMTMVRGETVYRRNAGDERFGRPVGENVRLSD